MARLSRVPTRLALLVLAVACVHCDRSKDVRPGQDAPTRDASSGTAPLSSSLSPSTRPPDAKLPAVTRWGAPADGTRRKAILLLHGAGGPKLITDHRLMRPYPEALVAAGYVVYMPHFRAGSEVEQARATLDWLLTQPDVRADRVGVVGFSRGGFAALETAAVDDRLRAAVDFYGGMHATAAERMTRMPPTLILHGDHDEAVPVAYAHDLEALFQRRHVDYEIHIYPGEEHGFRGDALPDSVRRMVAFFDAQLR